MQIRASREPNASLICLTSVSPRQPTHPSSIADHLPRSFTQDREDRCRVRITEEMRSERETPAMGPIQDWLPVHLGEGEQVHALLGLTFSARKPKHSGRTG